MPKKSIDINTKQLYTDCISIRKVDIYKMIVNSVKTVIYTGGEY